MKDLFKLTITAGMALLACAGVEAAQTNLVQSLNLRLVATFQGPTVTNGNVISQTTTNLTVLTGDVIQLLGAATTNDFSATARLLVITPLPDGDPFVVVRDGARTVGVRGFLSHDLQGATVQQVRINTGTGVARGVLYGIHRFELKDAAGYPALPGHFELSGAALVPFVSVLNRQGQVLGEAYEYAAAVSGTGDFDGMPAVIHGLISGKGRQIEILP